MYCPDKSQGNRRSKAQASTRSTIPLCYPPERQTASKHRFATCRLWGVWKTEQGQATIDSHTAPDHDEHRVPPKSQLPSKFGNVYLNLLILFLFLSFPFETFTNSIQLASTNVRGLREQNKRIACFNSLKEKGFEFTFLHEVFCTDNDQNIWENEWPGSSFWHMHNRREAGVGILIDPRVDFSVVGQKTDTSGRILALTIVIMEAVLSG